MAIELSVETQKRIEEKLKSGRYSSADELICAAIDALEELDSEGLDHETLEASIAVTNRSSAAKFMIGMTSGSRYAKSFRYE